MGLELSSPPALEKYHFSKSLDRQTGELSYRHIWSINSKIYLVGGLNLRVTGDSLEVPLHFGKIMAFAWKNVFV